jgi:hypothetical protein
MVFIALVILAIILYIGDFKVSAMLVFFFFITQGFNLVPEEETKFLFISKGMDYAFLIMAGIVLLDSVFIKNYLKPDNMTKFLLPMGIFLIICIAYNKFALGLGFSEILRTSRFLFFWLLWLIFRSLNVEQLNNLLKGLFYVSLLTSTLFILQLFDIEVLNEITLSSKTSVFGMTLTRFYNHPDMLHFFVFFAILCNPLKGILKWLTMFIPAIALMCAFHRSLTGSFFIALIIGYVVQLPRLQQIKVFSVAGFVIFAAVIFGSFNFVNSRTFKDIQNVMAGNFVDTESVDISKMQEGTFTFRIAHLVERNLYLQQHPKSMIIGAGLMTEDSKMTQTMFDFNIGLVEELSGQTVQLDTGDISYSLLFLRFGYLGTVLFLLPFVAFMFFFYKYRNDKLALASFMYLTLTIGVSFFSSNLVIPTTLIMPMIAYHIVQKSEKEF